MLLDERAESSSQRECIDLVDAALSNTIPTFSYGQGADTDNALASRRSPPLPPKLLRLLASTLPSRPFDAGR